MTSSTREQQAGWQRYRLWLLLTAVLLAAAVAAYQLPRKHALSALEDCLVETLRFQPNASPELLVNEVWDCVSCTGAARYLNRDDVKALIGRRQRAGKPGSRPSIEAPLNTREVHPIPDQPGSPPPGQQLDLPPNHRIKPLLEDLKQPAK